MLFSHKNASVDIQIVFRQSSVL